MYVLILVSCGWSEWGREVLPHILPADCGGRCRNERCAFPTVWCTLIAVCRLRCVPCISPITEGLGIANVDYYWYLNQSGTYTVDGTDDKKEFADTIVRIIYSLLLLQYLSIEESVILCSLPTIPTITSDLGFNWVFVSCIHNKH